MLYFLQWLYFHQHVYAMRRGKDRKCCQKSSGQLQSRGKKGKLIKGFLTIWLVVLKIRTFCSVHGRKIHDAAESNTIKAKERIFSRQKIRHSKIPNREGTTNTTHLRYLWKIYRLFLGKRLKFAPRSFQSKLTPSFLILFFHLIPWWQTPTFFNCLVPAIESYYAFLTQTE